uniref:OSJNBa0004B13.12 protein n=1 Tax=Oryza sativa subsp. japonica TaxID=39947 RepID=Q7F723_ORYSJ|nr:OSJNBa0004B13.12 [Oryza sativa Japonica Group]
MEMGKYSSSERKKGPEKDTSISVVTTATARRRCCGGDEHDTAARASVLHGDHHLGGIGKKVDASAGAGVRTLVERNDFYCQECNTHGK